MRTFSCAVCWRPAVAGFAQQFGPAENLAPYIPTPQMIVEKMLKRARQAGRGGLRPGQRRRPHPDHRRAEVRRPRRGRGDPAGPVPKGSRARQGRWAWKTGSRSCRAALCAWISAPPTWSTMYLLTGSNERLRPTWRSTSSPVRAWFPTSFPSRAGSRAEWSHVQKPVMDHTIYVTTQDRAEARNTARAACDCGLLRFPRVFQNAPRQVVLDLGAVARHLVVGRLQQLVLGVEQGFADVLLHARIVQVALPGRFLGNHLQDAIAVLGVDNPRQRRSAGSDITILRSSGLAFSRVRFRDEAHVAAVGRGVRVLRVVLRQHGEILAALEPGSMS